MSLSLTKDSGSSFPRTEFNQEIQYSTKHCPTLNSPGSWTSPFLSSLVFPAQNFFLWPSLLHYPVHWDSLCSSSKVQFVAHLFRGRQNERLSSVLLQHGLFPSSQCSLHPTVAIEIFMSSSYSRWWAPCGCMLQLIHFCIHGPNPSDTQ